MSTKSIRPVSRRMKGDSGQGMTEYIIIVALIAIAAIGIVTVFGGNIRALFGTSTAALAGDVAASSHAYNGNTQTYYGQKGMSTFGQRNQGH